MTMARKCDLSFQQRSLFQQGYQQYSPEQLRQLEWGLRFTPAACSLLTVVGLVYQLPTLLYAVSALGVWAFFAPAAHPMDLLYNHGFRHLFGAVRLPPNPLQRRLACLAAGVMNSAAATLFLLGLPFVAWIVGGMLLALQAIVIFTHFCTLSWMYEGIMRLLGRWHQPLDSAKAATLLRGGAVLVDVRGPEEFERDRLDNALNLPVDQIEEQLSVIGDQPCLIYCASGMRSQIAAKKLRALGLDAHDLGSLSRARNALVAPLGSQPPS